MARALTSDELILLRKDGQFTKLYLAVLNPNTVYTARLASLPSSTDNVHTISVNTESGTLSNVKAGMTVYVGSTLGASDLGMCRVRKAPITGTWYIGLTSEITWQSTCYLTIVDDFDLWAKHAVIESNALKMDVDVAYSDQHAAFNPVPVLGPHAVLWLTGATISVQFTASDSWVFDSTITGFSWSAPGASATSGLTTATPTLTYNAAGCYRVLCTVTAANGKTTTGVRHVFVFDAAHMPATVFQLAQCQAEYETGGWMFDVNMEAEASLSEIRDRSLVILFAEDWYGVPPNQVKQSIGPIAGRENIVCVGRVVGQSIRWDREAGNVHFVVQGAHHWLNKIKGFPIQIQPATVAASWSQMPLMTIDRVLWHVLYWHSTVIETMDFYPPNDARYTDQGMSMASSIWGQLVDIAFSKLLASPIVDRFGRLIIEVDPNATPEADRDWATVMALTDDDWQEGIDLQRVTVEDCSLIRLTSLLVNSSGSAITLYSLSPGHTPRRYGEPELLDRLLASSQADSNSKAGLVLGWRTNEFPDVPAILLQNNRMFDLAPRQFASLNMAAGDNPRGVAYDGNLIPRRVSLYFDGEIGFMHPEINFEGETFAQLSTNGDIPDVDADDLTLPPILSLPSLDLPDVPIILPGTIEPSENGPKKVLVHDATYGLIFSEDFDAGSPTWRTVNAGLTATQYQQINRIALTPSGGIYVAHRRQTGFGTHPFIAYAPSIGGTFTIVEDETSIGAKYSLASKVVGDVAVNPLTGQVMYVIGSLDGSQPFHVYTGSGTSFAQGVALQGVINSIGSLSYGFGNWRLTGALGGTPKFLALASGGGSIIRTVNMVGSTRQEHIPILTTDKLYLLNTSVGGLYLITSNGAVAGDFTTVIGSGLINVPLDTTADCDPTGSYLMARWDTGQRGKSSDGGATWSGMGSLPFSTVWCFANAGHADRWVAVAGSMVRASLDDGVTWINKEGTITAIAPIPSLNLVKVVSY